MSSILTMLERLGLLSAVVSLAMNMPCVALITLHHACMVPLRNASKPPYKISFEFLVHISELGCSMALTQFVYGNHLLV